MSEDIDLKEVTKAVQTVNVAFDEFKKTDGEREKEIKRIGAALPETEAKIAKIEADLDRAQKSVDDAHLAIKRAQRFGSDVPVVDLDKKAHAWVNNAANFLSRAPIAAFDAKALAEYSAPMETYWRKGNDALSDLDRKTLSVGGDPTGGYVVMPEMDGRIVNVVNETSPMRAYAQSMTIGSDAYEFIGDLNRASGGWVSETGARTETNTPDLSMRRIPVHEVYAFPFATQKLLDDAMMDMEAWLAGKVAEEFSLMENTAFVTGNGDGKPRGFLSYGAGTTNPGTIEQFPTGVSAGFAAAPNGGDALIDALYGLKAPYRANASWFMNRTTTKLARKLKDSDGAYLWSPGIAAGQPATLLGYPVAAFEDMPDPAASSLSIAVGDMRAAYLIVDRVGIRVLRDPYTSKPRIGFYTTKRVGGDVVNFEAIKLIRFNT